MHRLVCIGDSLTQGFKSGAILETDISYPAIIAYEMGLRDDQFRFPSFNGAGGLPINIEYLLSRLDHEYGEDVNWWEIPFALIDLRKWMDETEDYWERGKGSQPINFSGIYHNLAVWGFEMQDSYQVTAKMCADITKNPSDNWLNQIPEHAMFRTALRVLNPSGSGNANDLQATQFTRAEALAKIDGGIENLIVYLGANNVLSSVTSLKYGNSTNQDMAQPDPRKRKATVYTAKHYGLLLGQLMKQVDNLTANGGTVQRVFWGTVPPVTIPPVTNGVGGRLEKDHGLTSPYGVNDDPEWFRRYFRFYTRPWIPEKNFNRLEDPFLTGAQIIKIDQTIVQYKSNLYAKVDAHNQKRQQAGLDPDWFVVDLHWALERLAIRRYHEIPSGPPPPGWSPYELPDAYVDLDLNTRFLRARQGQRISGGFFSLDGVHPTTVGYGLVAQEVIIVMQRAGVKFYHGDGVTERVGQINVNFRRVVRRDSLIQRLPHTLDDIWEKLVDGDQIVDVFKRALRAFG